LGWACVSSRLRATRVRYVRSERSVRPLLAGAAPKLRALVRSWSSG